MRGRFATLAVLNFILLFLIPSAIAQEEAPEWRSVGIDPSTWTDGPVEEDTPMKESFEGNAIVSIEVSYIEGHGDSRESGIVILELFEQWAPITTANMIKNVEAGIYDGIFFHRVIDDFVTQAGDPTCKKLGVYPFTSPECGSGGTGTTIPLEHHEKLSHVDGAIGMARGADPDSADSQWYIAETEAHNLDPENRDDEGYATFGIVRDGMQHIRNIAVTPTSDDPTGDEDIQNPASSAGRPIYEVQIISVSMIGVSDPYGTINSEGPESQTYNTISDFDTRVVTSIAFIVAILLIVAMVYQTQIDPPSTLDGQSSIVLDAILFDESNDPYEMSNNIAILKEDKD
ncbi:MAG: peptidylprolyl isomerase [Candidatus Poseidoniales archaeon]|nr:MAG: peptidylprolyl isomerase [Candidatus Poseidoniales archaeon]